MEITELVSQLKMEADAEITTAEKTIQQLFADADMLGKYEENGAKETLENLKKFVHHMRI